MTIDEIVETVNQRVEEFRNNLIAELENSVVVVSSD
jgi:hypothetical protein